MQFKVKVWKTLKVQEHIKLQNSRSEPLKLIELQKLSNGLTSLHSGAKRHQINSNWLNFQALRKTKYTRKQRLPTSRINDSFSQGDRNILKTFSPQFLLKLSSLIFLSSISRWNFLTSWKMRPKKEYYISSRIPALITIEDSRQLSQEVCLVIFG